MQTGQHVVCVDDYFKVTPRDDRQKGVRYPVRGVVYTVRDVAPHPFHDGALIIRLMEIRNPVLNYRHRGVSLGRMEKGFRTERFKPLKKLKVEDFVTEKQPETV